MFKGCNSLENIIFGEKFSTPNVTTMYQMFNNCSSLTSLDIGRWNTLNVINMESMFNGCSNLTTINLSNADFSNVTSYTNMLNGVSTTNLVINGNAGLKEWFTTNYSDYANNVVVPSV